MLPGAGPSGVHQDLTFRPKFSELCGGLATPGDAAADAEFASTARQVDMRGANRDAESCSNGLLRRGNPTDCAAVDAAASPLDLLDDVHRLGLRRTGHRAAREHRAHDGYQSGVGSWFGGDLRRELPDPRGAL